MEEIVEQYKEAKKWKRDMLIAMAAMLALGVIMVVCGFIIKDLMVIFFIFGGIVAALGAVVCIVAFFTFKKADGIVREYLASTGKTQEEINAVLGDSTK